MYNVDMKTCRHKKTDRELAVAFIDDWEDRLRDMTDWYDEDENGVSWPKAVALDLKDLKEIIQWIRELRRQSSNGRINKGLRD